jgi:hypothetical protein
VLITRLLGKEFLVLMRQILSKEIHVEAGSVFEHPDLKERFNALRPELQR